MALTLTGSKRKFESVYSDLVSENDSLLLNTPASILICIFLRVIDTNTEGYNKRRNTLLCVCKYIRDIILPLDTELHAKKVWLSVLYSDSPPTISPNPRVFSQWLYGVVNARTVKCDMTDKTNMDLVRYTPLLLKTKKVKLVLPAALFVYSELEETLEDYAKTNYLPLLNEQLRVLSGILEGNGALVENLSIYGFESCTITAVQVCLNYYNLKSIRGLLTTDIPKFFCNIHTLVLETYTPPDLVLVKSFTKLRKLVLHKIYLGEDKATRVYLGKDNTTTDSITVARLIEQCAMAGVINLTIGGVEGDDEIKPDEPKICVSTLDVLRLRTTFIERYHSLAILDLSRTDGKKTEVVSNNPYTELNLSKTFGDSVVSRKLKRGEKF